LVKAFDHETDGGYWQSLQAFADAVLGPLDATGRAEELVRGLTAFLEHNGHWGSAASALRVHRHTMRHRIDAIQLYLQAATEYGDTSRAWLATALARPRSLADGLRAVYRYARDFYLAGDAPRGCFLLGTAVTEANRDPEVRAIVDDTMSGFTATFAERFGLDLAVLRLDQPGQLLQAVDQLMKDVGSAGIFGVDRVVHRANGVHGRVGTAGDQIHDLGGAVFVGRELRQRCGGRDGVGPAVGHRIQGAHPLGDGVAGLASEVNELVELQVKVAEVGSDDVPVRLLTLQVELDQIDQHPLQASAELG
jgi:hypothetical protein